MSSETSFGGPQRAVDAAGDLRCTVNMLLLCVCVCVCVVMRWDAGAQYTRVRIPGRERRRV